MHEDLSKTMVPGTIRTAEILEGADTVAASQSGLTVTRIESAAPVSDAAIVIDQPVDPVTAATEPAPAAADPDSNIAGSREYVVGYVFSPKGDQIVLIEKDHPAWQAGKYNGVGGKIEPGETIAAAMSREFGEEAGVYISQDRWQHFRTEQFDATSSNKSDQDAGTKVHHLVAAVSEVEFDAIHTAEKEKVVKLPYPLPASEYPNLIYNIVYLVPMAHALYGLAPENRPSV